MKKIMSLLICAILAFSSLASANDDTACFYVSEKGSDYGKGTEISPYKTVNRAIAAVRYLRKKGDFKRVEIVLTEGEYFIPDTITLTDKNISFVGENAVITGAYTFDLSQTAADTGGMSESFPDSSLDKIRCLDLSFMNYIEYPNEVNSTYSETSDYIVAFDGVPMTLARYPDSGTMTVKTVYESGADEAEGRFVIGYEDENISNWKNPQNAYMEGFGKYLWRYQKIRLSEIDTEAKKIVSQNSLLFTSINSGAEVWFSNVSQELNSENEYYIDRENKKLYFIPPADSGKISVSVSKQPFFNILGAENITFSGITFENVNAKAVNVIGSKKIIFDNCEIRNTGAEAVKFSECRYSGVKNSLIYQTGAGGIIFSDCGKKYNLTPSENFVLNNEICDYSRIIPTDSPAIEVNGIKDRIAYNTIHDSFNYAIFIIGNDNVISNNEIYNVLNGTEDAGAIYMWGDASSRGNIIENNLIHHIGNGKTKFQNEGLFGIYFDNFNSGQIVRNNVFYDIPTGIHINGGNSHLIENNVFNYVDVPLFAHTYETHPSTGMWNGYLSLEKNEDIWLARYPELAEIPDPNEPAKTYFGNIFRNNLIACSGSYTNKISESGTTQENNILTEADVFCDKDSLDFSLTAEFPNFVPFEI